MKNLFRVIYTLIGGAVFLLDDTNLLRVSLIALTISGVVIFGTVILTLRSR